MGRNLWLETKDKGNQILRMHNLIVFSFSNSSVVVWGNGAYRTRAEIWDGIAENLQGDWF